MTSIPRGCDIYCQPDQILIAARVTDITLRKGPAHPFSSFRMNTTSEELGNAIIYAMEMLRSGLTEQDFDSEIARFFEFAEVKGWNSLERNWNYIAVCEAPSKTIIIQPTKQYRSGGYISETGDPEWSSPPEPEELGKTLQEAIQHVYQK